MFLIFKVLFKFLLGRRYHETEKIRKIVLRHQQSERKYSKKFKNKNFDRIVVEVISVRSFR